MTTIAQRVHANFKKNMGEKRTTLPLGIQKVEMASTAIARVVVAIPDVFYRSINDTELAASVSAQLPGVRYLDGSLSRTEKEGLYTMFLSATPKVMTKEAASSVVLHEVASGANVFRDDDDNIRSFSEDAHGGHFTAQDVEDLEGLILGVRNRNKNIATASLEIATSEAFAPGDAIVIYDVATAGQAFGIAVDETEAFFPSYDKVIPVNPITVIGLYESARDAKMPRIDFDKKDKKKLLLDYMRALYGQSPAYYKRIETLVRSHLKV